MGRDLEMTKKSDANEYEQDGPGEDGRSIMDGDDESDVFENGGLSQGRLTAA